MSQIDLVHTTTRPSASVPWFQDASAENASAYTTMFQTFLMSFIKPELGETVTKTETELEQKITIILSSRERAEELEQCPFPQLEYSHIVYNIEHGITMTGTSEIQDKVIQIDLALLKQYYNYPPD